MESQVAHGHVHEHDTNSVELHSAVEGEGHGEHHQEKKSVLKKVKAKAKKLKDTIAKHGHGHGHDHDNPQEGHAPDDQDLDEEDDEEEYEEMVEDPEVHGAPVYESTAMRAPASRPTATELDKNSTFERNQEHATRSFEENPDRLRADHRETMLVEEGTRAPANTPQATVPSGTTTQAADPAWTLVHETPDQCRVNLTRPVGLEEDPDAPKDREELYRPSNYQTKVTDPAGSGSGGYEAKIAPLDQSFNAMQIRDQTETKPNQLSGKSMGSHDQFSPEPVTKETETLLGNREPAPESDTATTTKGRPEDEKPSSPGSYTSAVADKATVIKNILTSKLGYGTSPEVGDVNEKSGDGSPRQGGYAEKISSATYAIADKALSAKNLVASKIGYGTKEDQATQESSGLTEQPGDKPSEQSSYTGKIAAVAGSAKDTVASKLSYAKKDDVASLETEQKIGGGSAEETAPATQQGKKVAGQDKGVSVRDYLADKLKPGEEDKALSEVISSALDRRKKETEKPVVVTESEEVSQHLREGGRGQGQLSSPGRAVVDKLKGAVGSWLGKRADARAPQHSHGNEAILSGTDTAPEGQDAGERRLQESMS